MKIRVKKPVKQLEAPKQEPKKQKETKPFIDEYKPMCEGERIHVRSYLGYGGKEIKDYLDFSVKRFDDTEHPVTCFMSMYRESEKYTGFLKGKTVHFPIDRLADVIEALQVLDDRVEPIRESERRWES